MSQLMKTSMPIGPTGYAVQNRRVKKFILQDTGTYNDLVTRPLCLNADQRSYDAVIDAAVQSLRVNKRVNPTTIAQMASTYITPSAMPEAAVAIPNGWSTKRLRFVLVIEYTSTIGSTTESMVYGYTDYLGVSTLSSQPVFDPNMMFYINGVVDLRISMSRSQAFGNQEHRSVLDFSNVMFKDVGVNATPYKNSYKIVPESVFNGIASQELSGMHDSGFVEDISNQVGTIPTRVDKNNAVPSSFISSTINSYCSAMADSSHIADSEILSSAASYASSNTHRCEFIDQIRTYNGHGGRFTISDLLEFDQGAMQPGVFAPMINAGINVNNQLGNYAPWSSSNIETQMAQFVTSTLPAIMVRCGATDIGFTSTNSTIDGRPVTSLHLLQSNIGQINDSTNLALINAIDCEIIPAVSFNNEVMYMLQAKCSIYGNVEVHISINGGELMPYMSPAFADSLSSTNVTYSKDHVPKFSAGIGSLMQEAYLASNEKPTAIFTTQQTGGY